jgi:phosphoribosylcarboxyaminoimidazole (NCAIR) mutase
MRRIGVMIGSDSDLFQCKEGFSILHDAEESGKVKVVAVITSSIHRNHNETLQYLRTFTREKDREFIDKVDVWIIGAGWANHLTGICDSYLRYVMNNNRVPVIGVAFESEDPEKTKAAILSITAVPGTQVIFNPSLYVGKAGFALACQYAIFGNLPELKLPKPKSVVLRSLNQAIYDANK